MIWAHTDGNYDVSISVEGTITHTYVGYGEGTNIIVSTQNRPVKSTVDEESGKHTGTIEYTGTKLTFTSEEEIDVELTYRRLGETLKEPPEGAKPSGIYMEINVSRGELPPDVEILLEVDYTRDDIPEGMNELQLRLFRFNEETEEWEKIPKQEVDIENKILRAWLTGFSEFAIFEVDEEEDEAVDEEETADDESEEEESDEVTSPATGDRGIIPEVLLLMTGLMIVLLTATRRRKTTT